MAQARNARDNSVVEKNVWLTLSQQIQSVKMIVMTVEAITNAPLQKMTIRIVV